MPANFTTTPTSTTTLSTNQFPVSAVFVPGTAGGDLTALQGGPASTDGNGYTSAPVAVYQATGTNLHVVVDSGAITASGTVTANQGGTWNLNNISGTISLPTGAATAAKQPALGTAGAASSDVLTVQGIAAMTPLKVDGSGVTQPVSGTITADAGSGTFTVAGTVTANAGTGTFTIQQTNITADYDTGAGTQNLTMFGLALPASGGAVAGGTSSNPLRIDPTGTTTQPVSGTVTANAGSGTFNIQANASVNINQIAGAAVSTAASGIQKVGLVGNTGAALDAAGQNAASPANELLVAGQFNTTPTTITSGNVSPLQLDSAGNLLVNVKAGGGSGGTSSSFNAAFPATGTAAGASDGTNMKPLLVDASGFLKVNVAAGGASGGTSSSFGAAFPATGTAAGYSDGTNMQGARAFDVDTGAGTQYVAGANLRISGSGGSIEAKGQQTMANSLPVAIASDQGAVTVTANAGTGTFTVSGTVTANAGTGTFNNQQTNITADYDTGAGTQTMTMWGLALPASGGAVAGGTATNPLQVSLANTGANGTALKVDGSGVTQPVSGTVTANQGGAPWSQNLTQIGGNAVVTGGATGLLAVAGPVASGAANADNPVKVGGVFNTTQPTVTTGQVVDAQMTARGAQLVATGVDTFNVTVNAALPTGGNTIGAVTQASGPWTSNVTQFGGSNVVTGTGASGAGIPRVTLSNDSSLAANQSVNANQIGGSAIATAAAGVQKVGVVGNTGATLDSTIGAGAAPANALAVGAVYNSSAPAPSSGQAMAVQADQAGNLRVFPGIALAALSAWNSATALNAVQTIFANSGTPAVLVQLDQTTTITAGAITFEVTYDGTSWVAATASQVTDPTSSTYAQIALPYTLQASTNKPFIISNNGWQGLRIKLSTQITGTGTVTPNYALLPYDPIESSLVYVPANLSQANQVPVSNAGQQGMLTLTGSLVANSDNAITFSGNATIARRIRIQNESAGTIYWALDATASTGSPSLAAPAANAVMVEWINQQCTTLHIFIPSGGTTTLNGSGGVKVSAWA